MYLTYILTPQYLDRQKIYRDKNKTSATDRKLVQCSATALPTRTDIGREQFNGVNGNECLWFRPRIVSSG